MQRLKANSKRVPDFIANFDRATRDLWTSYVTHEMARTFDDANWPPWGRLLSFAIRGALTAVIPVSAIAMGASKLVGAALEKAGEFGLDEANTKVGQDDQSRQVHSKAGDLRKRASAVSDAIEPALRLALKPLSEGVYYLDWLRVTPLEELHKFRIPPLCPKISAADMKRELADRMAGFAWSQEYGIPRRGQQNVFDIGLTTTKNGAVTTNFAHFNAAPAFREAFKGQPIARLPHVPVHIELTGGYKPEDISIEGMAIWGKSPLEHIWDAFRQGSITKIYRPFGSSDFYLRSEGSELYPSGDLGTHLVLAQMGDPDLDVVALVKGAMSGLGGPPYPAKTGADVVRILRLKLQPLVNAGIDRFVDDEIMPRVVV